MLTPFQLGKPATNSPNAENTESDVDRRIAEIRAAALAGQPLKPLMTEIMRAWGFEHFAYAITTVGHPNRDSRSFVWTTLPWDWVTEYDQNAYVEIDPRITLTWGRSAPLVWDSADMKGDSRLSAFFARAAHYGIRSGVTISFGDPAFARIGVAISSPISPVTVVRRKEIDSRLGDFMMFSARFHDLFVANYVDSNKLGPLGEVPLSPRERECLALAARGMTSAEIGIKLGISERTANFHFTNIVGKLGAVNRKEAIAMAVTRGVIRVDN